MISHPDKPRARYFHQRRRNAAQPRVRRFFPLCFLLAAVVATLTGLAVFRSPSALAQSGNWTTKASMPTARVSLGVGVVNGTLYAVGGHNGAALTTVEAYDPGTDTWTTKSPMSTPRNGVAVGVVNGLLYAVGGDTDSGAAGFLASVEAYDPLTDTWSPRASMQTPRDIMGVGVDNGILYAMGGQANGIFLSTVEAYDPVTDTWTTKASMPNPRGFFGVGVINGIIYAAGGQGGGGAVATLEAYDPATDTWATLSPMPTSRTAPASAVLNGILYVIGGEGGTCGPNCSVVEAYDPAMDTWTTVSPMPTGRGLLAAGVIGNSVYAVGGRNSLGDLSTVEAFTIEAPIPTPTPVCTSPPSNMVSWWPGDGNANDIQDGNNGALQNGAAFAPGKVAQAFSFDGVDDFVEVQNSANLNLTQALTIDAWVNPSVANQYGGIVEKTVGDQVNTQYLLHLEGGVAFFRLIIVPGVDHRTVHSNSAIPINEWTHIAGTWDGATMNLFINGVQQTETLAVTPPINSGAGPTLIGRLGQNIYHFAGLIDEVEIFNRALSTQEIIALYLADSAGKCKNNDQCPDDPNKTAPGICGCGVADTDTDNDGTPDCNDACPSDPNKINPGACGCGVADADTDHDDTPDCNDACPSDPNKTNPGACGCGVPDTDSDGDGIPNCHDNCPVSFNPDQRDTDGNGAGDVCTPFQYPAGGMFVIGDQVSLANGATVNFWGSQWSKNNPMSGGSAPNSFKGFENGSATAACGSNWTTGPGNSSSPPSTVPQYMALIVSSSIQKNGSVLSGDVKKIVVVRTNPGYGPSPGHASTGQIVAILCVTNQSANMFHQLWIPLDSLILPAGVVWLDRRWLPAS